MLDSWLDLFLGSVCVGCGRPGRPLCGDCRAELPTRGAPVRPDPCPAGLAPAFAAGAYEATLRAMVLAHKERSAFALARPLGAVLAGVLWSLAEGIGRAPGASPREPGAVLLLVPVPSRARTVRRRGHDPVRRMVRHAAVDLRRAGIRCRAAPVLRQRLAVADQAGLDARQRAANLHGSLAVRPASRRALARLAEPVGAVICDDVLTTGATAREAQRALASAGIPVLGIACLAATRRRHRPSLPFSQISG